jgi:hypothetical protein
MRTLCEVAQSIDDTKARQDKQCQPASSLGPPTLHNVLGPLVSPLASNSDSDLVKPQPIATGQALAASSLRLDDCRSPENVFPQTWKGKIGCIRLSPSQSYHDYQTDIHRSTSSNPNLQPKKKLNHTPAQSSPSVKEVSWRKTGCFLSFKGRKAVSFLQREAVSLRYSSQTQITRIWEYETSSMSTHHSIPRSRARKPAPQRLR